MSQRIQHIIEDITEQYLENDGNIPWIIGFSGGKDSTVVLKTRLCGAHRCGFPPGK